MDIGVGTEVEHSTPNPQIKGLNPAGAWKGPRWPDERKDTSFFLLGYLVCQYSLGYVL